MATRTRTGVHRPSSSSTHGGKTGSNGSKPKAAPKRSVRRSRARSAAIDQGDEKPLLERLNNIDPKTKLEALFEAGVTDRDLARGTGASEATVVKWRHGNSHPRAGRHLEAINDLAALFGYVLAADSARAAVLWVRDRNKNLDMDSPLDRVAAGDFASALKAAEAFTG